MNKSKTLLVALALASAAFAQSNAPQAVPAAPAQANAPAPTVDPAKLALAREAIAALQADKMFDGLSAQMKQMALQMSPLPANATPEQKQRFEKYLGRVMDLSMDSAKAMIVQMDQTYAEVFSDAELHAITAFYTSPEGRSMMAKTPLIMQRVMPVVQQMQRELMPKLQKLAEEARAEEAAQTAAPAPADTPAPKPSAG